MESYAKCINKWKPAVHCKELWKEFSCQMLGAYFYINKKNKNLLIRIYANYII